MDKCPISGQPCPHNKQVHVTEVSNFQATEVKHLCVLCGLPYMAQEGGASFNTNFPLFELVNSIIKNPTVSNVQVVLQPPGCPECGQTIEEIAHTGKLGCGHCYEFYKSQIIPIIAKCQSSNTQHIGKIPKTKPKVESVKSIEKLEADLKEAIAKEEYENAAIINEQIKKLQTGQ